MTLPKVVAVILNLDRPDDTEACLANLLKSTYQNLHTIVIDVMPRTQLAINKTPAFPRTQIVEVAQNLGYAGNNNIGIMLAMQQGADWIWVLNNDTTAAPDCLEKLVSTGAADDRAGIVGPLIFHYDEPTVIQSAGGRLDKNWNSDLIGLNEPDVGQFASLQAVDWLSGCCLLVRRSLIEQIGMFDERFFMYFEETDWCIRARAHNWQLIQAPQAKLWHKGVQRNYQPPPAVTYYMTRNKFLLMLKHRASARAFVYQIMQTVRTLTSWTMKPRWRFKQAHRNAMWLGLQDFFLQRWGKKLLV